MSMYETLQAEHQTLLEQQEASGDSKAMLAAVQAHIERVKTEAAQVGDPRDRSQLRANLRYWASFVFDQTGEYPDTTLRPALEAAPATPPKPSTQPWTAVLRKPAFWLAALGALAGLALVIAASYALLIGPQLRSQNAAAVATLNAQGTEIVHSARLTATSQGPAQPGSATPNIKTAEVAMPASETPAVSTPLPPTLEATAVVIEATPEDILTDTPASPVSTVPPATATMSALITQMATIYTATPMPTPEQQPEAGGGDGDWPDFKVPQVRMEAAVESTPGIRGCGLRSLEIKVASPDLFRGLSLSPAAVLVRTVPGGSVVMQQSLDFGGKSTLIDLSSSESDVLVVQIAKDGFLFDAVIVQFLPDCSRHQTLITYTAFDEDPATVRERLQATGETEPSLGLDWWLETWGPAPFWSGWVVEVAFEGQGGSGSYVYWSYDDPLNPLPEGRLVTTIGGCQRAFLQIGVTAGGASASQSIALLSPYCLGVPTPRPTSTATRP
ncbi:MAG TPA: hypothetical protein PKM21_14395 [Anaerolineales bacterium]|nr:hypothetical protein [Anaerolineales bacterium]